ncbi:MAG: hypothetical protein ABDH37_06695 [Candidatus Hydrothermales bacterium]
MIVYILLSLNLNIGAEIRNIGIKDFNKHLDLLERRAKTLGWIGSFGRFRSYNFSPIFLFKIYEVNDIETKNYIKFLIGGGFLFDRVKGNFYYKGEENSFEIKQRWEYFIFFLNSLSYIKIKKIGFLIGYEFPFANLKVDIKSNFKLNEEYPKNYKGGGLGFFTGIFKDFKNFNISFLFGESKILNFGRNGKFLLKDEEGYIYERKNEYKFVRLKTLTVSFRIIYSLNRN